MWSFQSPSITSGLNADPELHFFKEDLKLTDKEIENVSQDAIDFFNRRFGLDLSASEPNELGKRVFENAMLFPNKFPVTITATHNRWLVSGRVGQIVASRWKRMATIQN